MNKTLSQSRYFEIRQFAIECINIIVENKNGFKTIDYYMNGFKSQLKSDEELILFQSMVLFPDTEKILQLYKSERNLLKLSKKIGIHEKFLTRKLNCIARYEERYEEKNTNLKISTEDPIAINNRIINYNIEIDRSINLIHQKENSKNTNKFHFKRVHKH